MNSLSQINLDKNVSPDDIRNNFKLNYIVKFEQALMDNLGNRIKKNKLQLCKDIGISNTTLKKYMRDLEMKSFYRHDNLNIKKIKPKTKSKIKKSSKSDDELYESLNAKL